MAASLDFRCRSVTKGLFTWREGAPANRTTRLEGLTHSPPLHAAHLTGTFSGLRELSFERPLSTANKMANQRNLAGYPVWHVNASMRFLKKRMKS